MTFKELRKKAERTFTSYQHGLEVTAYGPANGQWQIGEGLHSLGKWRRGSSKVLLGLGTVWSIWKEKSLWQLVSFRGACLFLGHIQKVGSQNTKTQNVEWKRGETLAFLSA